VIKTASKGAFDSIANCARSLSVKNTSILLRMLLIVGLVVSPLYPPVFAASGDTMMMSAAQPSSDEMPPRADAEHGAAPCHDGGKMDCDKPCPCMAACMSLSVQGLPSTASTVAGVVAVGQRFAIRSEVQLANLAAPPPARPPRA
jgi:hypothetical protein